MIHGVDFLRKFSLGESVSIDRKVVIVGGGNTAIDAARSVHEPAPPPDPDSAIALNVLGSILHRQGELDEAARDESFVANVQRVHQRLVEYLKAPPDAETALSVARMMGVHVHDLLRTQEADYKTLIATASKTDDRALAEQDERIRNVRGEAWVRRVQLMTATWTADTAAALVREAFLRHLAGIAA